MGETTVGMRATWGHYPHTITGIIIAIDFGDVYFQDANGDLWYGSWFDLSYSKDEG